MFQKTLLCLFIAMGMAASLSAQTYSRELGKIGKDEIELKVYAKDKDAEAVILFDIGDSEFVRSDTGFDVVFERKTRVKILKDAGLDWAEFEIPIYHDNDIYENLYEMQATTYNFEDGRLTTTSLDPTTVYSEKINDHWEVKKFAMPKVKVGSIIECQYKIQSQYVYNLRDWEFQSKIPAIYSEYTVHINPFLYYVFWMQGSKKLDVFDKYEDFKNSHPLPYATAIGNGTYNDMVYVFGANDVPAFRDEEFITSVNDYIMKIHFQLAQVNRFDGATQKIMTTWEDLVKELDKHSDYGRYVDRSEKMASKLLNLDELAAKSEAERFDEVVEFVKTNYSWDGKNGMFATKTPDRLVKEKIGNDADLNLFTVGLLRAAGINATPMISSTRGHGRIQSDYPFSSLFNYSLILAEVNGKLTFSDATEPLVLNNRIPSRCINDRGLTIDRDEIKWIGLDTRVPSYFTTRYTLVPTAELDMNASIEHYATEYEAARLRESVGDDPEKIKEKLSVGSFSFDQESVSVENLKDKQKPFGISYQQKGRVERLNDKLYIDPFLGQGPSDNPLKQDVRIYPVDINYPKQRSMKSEIEIPEGYQVEYTPKERTDDNELYNLFYQVNKEGNKVTIQFSYYLKQSTYDPKLYDRMKSFFASIAKYGTEKIVLAPEKVHSNSDTGERELD